MSGFMFCSTQSLGVEDFIFGTSDRFRALEGVKLLHGGTGKRRKGGRVWDTVEALGQPRGTVERGGFRSIDSSRTSVRFSLQTFNKRQSSATNFANKEALTNQDATGKVTNGVPPE